MRRLSFAAALVALVAWAGASYGQAAKDPKSYKIGAILAMSGQASFYVPPPPPGGAKQVDSPCRLRKRVQHSLFFSIAATTFGTAFYIMLLLGFAWLVRADIIFLK